MVAPLGSAKAQRCRQPQAHLLTPPLSTPLLALPRSSKRATRIQAAVRMYLQRKRFLHETEVGRRAAERAAAEAARTAAATAIQKHVRRRLAAKRVGARVAAVWWLRVWAQLLGAAVQPRGRLKWQGSA